jgi:hypothetical protein
MTQRGRSGWRLMGFELRIDGASAQGQLLTAAEQRVATSDDAQSSIYRRASQPQT